MGQFEIVDDRAFLAMISDAQEIVLGSAGVRVPEQRTDGAYYDVTSDCIVLTDGMAAYGC
jgi:hypothetical protein